MHRSALLVLALPLAVLADDASLLVHGDFDEWKDGTPVGWKVSIGAQGAGEKESVLEKGKDGGLALSGDAATGKWRAVSQRFRAAPGKRYEVTFEARVEGVKREGKQSDNVWVGLGFPGSKSSLPRVSSIASVEWKEERVFAVAPAGTTEAEVTIFLSKTGRIEVRKIRARERSVEDTFAESFQTLVDDMERHYSYFEIHGKSWDELVAKTRPEAEKAKDLATFIDVVRGMLAKLEDHHIWIVPEEGKLIPTWAPDVPKNYDYGFVWKERLVSPRQIGKLGFTGRTKDGYAYVAIGSLQGDDATFAKLDEAIEELLDAPGLILDLRANGGGEERRGQHIASVFADERRVYAKRKLRSGPKHTDFTEPHEFQLEPREGKRFTKPIVCLTGRVCMSSGEGFVKMMKALPHVTLVGQPTRGASGNPSPVALPCGIQVFYSRWIDMLPDGTVTEGHGVTPDLVVDPKGEGDPTFDAAVKELARRIAAK
jgi:hypothetical protein